MPMRREAILADSGHINIGKAFDWVVTQLNQHVQWLFDFITTVLNWCIDTLSKALDWGYDFPSPTLTLPGAAGTVVLIPQHTPIILILAAIAWLVRSWQFGLLALVSLWFLDNLRLWKEAMSSLSLVLVATVII